MAGVLIPTVFSSATELQITLDGTPKTAGLIEQTDVREGTATSNALPFNWAARPTITLVEPDIISQTDAAKTLTITGTNFVAATRIWISGNEHPSVLVSPTQMTISVDPVALGWSLSTKYVRAQTGIGRPPVASNDWPVGVWEEVGIDAITPTTIASGSPDTPFTINAEGNTSLMTVIFDGVDLPTTYSGSVISFTVPASLLATARTAKVDLRVSHVGHNDNLLPPGGPIDFIIT